MILSNSEILKAIKDGDLAIGNLTGDEDPSKAPFNTSSIDLHLSPELAIPKKDRPSSAIDLRRPAVTAFFADHYDSRTIQEDQPFTLDPNRFILARTQERVAFPVRDGRTCYSARVEGRSSLARCGILVHFTAPTIHANFEGTIALEVINLGRYPLLLYPGLPFCQLIVEVVKGAVTRAPNQFSGQSTPTGR